MKKAAILLATTLMSTAGFADDNWRGKNQYRTYHDVTVQRHITDEQSNYRRDRGHKSEKREHHADRGWQTVSAFRGRSGKYVTRSIPVHDKVQALSIQGTKRGMVVQRAHAVMGNGRWVRLHNLEGRITEGDLHRQRLNHPRNVQRVVLDIAPDRHKRGYAELKVKRAR